MSKWYLDENDRDIYWKDDKGFRWDYNTKELVRILNDLETKLRDVEQEQIKEMQEHQEAMELADKTITSLVEDNRASQEWYKKQLSESEEFLIATKWKVQDLNKQLAEKEEQVLKSQEMYFETLKEYDELEDNFNNISLELWAEKLITQDKILFAVEQLKKTQSYVDNQCFMARYKSERKAYAGVWNYIDNQIKQLKEMK